MWLEYEMRFDGEIVLLNYSEYICFMENINFEQTDAEKQVVEIQIRKKVRGARTHKYEKVNERLKTTVYRYVGGKVEVKGVRLSEGLLA